MAFGRIDGIGGQAIDEVSSTQVHPLGYRVIAQDPTYGQAEFVYVKGVASCVVGSVLTFNAYSGVTALATTRSKGLVGVAVSALVASTYGFIQVTGAAVAKSLASAVAGATAYATGTAGSVDDAVVTGDVIYGATYASASDVPSSGFAVLSLAHPYLGDTDNA
jgi:hypothetical protein